jgi:hypothetical protein
MSFGINETGATHLQVVKKTNVMWNQQDANFTGARKGQKTAIMRHHSVDECRLESANRSLKECKWGGAAGGVDRLIKRQDRCGFVMRIGGQAHRKQSTVDGRRLKVETPVDSGQLTVNGEERNRKV